MRAIKDQGDDSREKPSSADGTLQVGLKGALRHPCMPLLLADLSAMTPDPAYHWRVIEHVNSNNIAMQAFCDPPPIR